MNKNIFNILLILPLLFSCSEVIPEDERYEELPAIEAKRRILLEDFTGQFCSNCPEAHKVIRENGRIRQLLITTLFNCDM